MRQLRATLSETQQIVAKISECQRWTKKRSRTAVENGAEFEPFVCTLGRAIGDPDRAAQPGPIVHTVADERAGAAPIRDAKLHESAIARVNGAANSATPATTPKRQAQYCSRA